MAFRAPRLAVPSGIALALQELMTGSGLAGAPRRVPVASNSPPDGIDALIKRQQQLAALGAVPTLAGGPSAGIPAMGAGLATLAAQAPPQADNPAPQPASLQAPTMAPKGVPASAPRLGQRKPVSALRTVADVVFGGENPFDSIDAQMGRYQMEQAALARRDQLLQFAQTLPEGPVREAFLLDPEGFSKSFYDPKTVGQNVFNPATGQWDFKPQVNVVSDQIATSRAGPDGSVVQDFQAPDKLTPYQEAQIGKPVTVSPGSALVDPATGKPLFAAPDLKIVGQGDSLVQVPGSEGGDDLWSRLIRQESGGNQDAISVKGAFGRAQLMPETAAALAAQLGDPSLADRARTDPVVNEQLGRYYLGQLQQQFGSDTAALAAYNAGPGVVQDWIKRFGDPRQVGDAAWIAQIPYAETKAYVSNILGGGQGGAKVIAQGQPKPGFRPATNEEKAAYGLPPEQPAMMGPDGKIEAIGDRLKPVPPVAQKAIIDNELSLKQLDRALAAVAANPKAFGWGNAVGPDVLQYTDPAGVGSRAVVADIGSLILHDRSGAAVTLSEAPRFAPFVPKITDTPEAITKKLQQLRNKLADEQAWLTSSYGPDSGYRPSPTPPAAPPQKPVAPRVGAAPRPITAAKPPASAPRKATSADTLPEGATVQQGGITYVKRNGQWVAK